MVQIRRRHNAIASAIVGLVVGWGAIASVPGSAHQVEIQNDVGATLHIEPDDTPQAGRPTLAWFALTRRGGRTIPLSQCDCSLAVYALPLNAGEPPLLTPPLQPVDAERYAGIPGAELTFPDPGAYRLQLSGSPQAGEDFTPFEFAFDVTVSR
ncbi:hypothetical protein KR51_00023870 [Rubidibacter lacunae KORDI 51-2]|uniref:Uncharacterized protein n=1 Tax=Rubidibacter lacunae KORDI 51-2 TaxID=582515 RepID=U5DKP4_9CHRO|nr:hypothetical protein [Rubidibacter lacunae]ERN41124.1 hypothetical protein KR51_00023870 [Rubidibacter lacunae KORDI 51-2]